MVDVLKKSFLMALFFALAFPMALAQSPGEISLDLRADTYYVHPGETFTVSFDLYNPMPSGDNKLDRIDAYLLDLKAQGFSVASWGKTGWDHTFVERFGDEQFWINNATNQGLEIVLKAEANAKTAKLEGFYSFNKTSGTQFLKDHSEFSINVNVVPQGQQTQPPAKTQITKKEQDQNNLVLALSALVVALVCVIIFLQVRKGKAGSEAKFAHKKK